MLDKLHSKIWSFLPSFPCTHPGLTLLCFLQFDLLLPSLRWPLQPLHPLLPTPHRLRQA